MRERSARGSIWLALIAGVVLQLSTDGKPAPDLSGSWVRDSSASEDAVEKAGGAERPDQHSAAVGPGVSAFPAASGIRARAAARRAAVAVAGARADRGRHSRRGHTGQRSGGGGPVAAAVPTAAAHPAVERPAAGAGGAGGGGSSAVQPSGGTEVEAVTLPAASRPSNRASRAATDPRRQRETRVLFTDGRVLGDGIGTKTVAAWRGDTLQVDTRGSLGRRARTGASTAAGSRSRPLSTWVAAVASPSPRSTIASRGVGAPVEQTRPESRRSMRRQVARLVAVAVLSRPLDADPPSIGPATPPPTWPTLSTRRTSRAPASRRSDPLPPTPRPGGGLLSGKVVFDTLTIDPEVAVVEFYLDGQRVSRRAWPPFETKLTLADPPREQSVRAVALAADDRVLGED